MRSRLRKQVHNGTSASLQQQPRYQQLSNFVKEKNNLALSQFQKLNESCLQSAKSIVQKEKVKVVQEGQKFKDNYRQLFIQGSSEDKSLKLQIDQFQDYKSIDGSLSQQPQQSHECSFDKLQEIALLCPRCKSMDTKFCYYNNYKVNQPRYFCKACQRYWTAGGTIRNVALGAGRRKQKGLEHQKDGGVSSSSRYSRPTSSNLIKRPSISDRVYKAEGGRKSNIANVDRNLLKEKTKEKPHPISKDKDGQIGNNNWLQKEDQVFETSQEDQDIKIMSQTYTPSDFSKPTSIHKPTTQKSLDPTQYMQQYQQMWTMFTQTMGKAYPNYYHQPFPMLPAQSQPTLPFNSYPFYQAPPYQQQQYPYAQPQGEQMGNIDHLSYLQMVQGPQFCQQYGGQYQNLAQNMMNKPQDQALMMQQTCMAQQMQMFQYFAQSQHMSQHNQQQMYQHMQYMRHLQSWQQPYKDNPMHPNPQQIPQQGQQLPQYGQQASQQGQQLPQQGQQLRQQLQHQQQQQSHQQQQHSNRSLTEGLGSKDTVFQMDNFLQDMENIPTVKSEELEDPFGFMQKQQQPYSLSQQKNMSCQADNNSQSMLTARHNQVREHDDTINLDFVSQPPSPISEGLQEQESYNQQS